jgi:TRAP-type mannitol/chloroaromatic compound transport system permease large subunit
MIPPSIVLIMYGLITETSIKALFTASFLPGFMLATFFILYIIVRTRMNPSLAPLPEPDPTAPHGSEKSLMFLGFMAKFAMWVSGVIFARAVFFTLMGSNKVTEGVDPIFLGMVSDLPYIIGAFALCFVVVRYIVGKERTATGWEMGKGLIAPTVVIGVVLGSIYGGITGITEAAGMGVIAVFVISALRGEMTFDIVYDSLMRTLKSTGTIIWVTIGAAALAAAYTLSGGPTYVANMIVGAELPTMGVILVMMLIFLVMGMFMDWIGIVLLIMPVFLPIVLKLPIDEFGVVGGLESKHVGIWFGVVFCMNMQVSFLSPPFGPAAFYLKSVAPSHITLIDIFKGFLPFILIQLCALGVLLVWPPIIAVFL